MELGEAEKIGIRAARGGFGADSEEILRLVQGFRMQQQTIRAQIEAMRRLDARLTQLQKEAVRRDTAA